MELRNSNSTASGVQLAALAILPDRALAQQFLHALAESRAFHLTAEWTAYPPVSKLESQLRQRRPEVLVIDVSANPALAMKLIEAAAGFAPPVPVIALHTANEAGVLLGCLRAGATEFLYTPFTPPLQRQAADRISRLHASTEPGAVRRGRLVVFSSAKPGSGASTLAAHTAFALREVTGERILLVDFSLWSGTVRLLFKLPGAPS